MSENLVKRFTSSPLWILVVSLLVAGLRRPSLWSNPRFFAEEGRVYFSYAKAHGFWESLLSPHQGYYSLLTNIFTLIPAKFAALESAPLWTQSAALISVAIPIYLVATSRSEIFSNRLTRWCVALAIASIDGGEGMMLTSLSTQFHLGLAGIILLYEIFAEENEPRSTTSTLSLLVLCSFSSPMLGLLTPFFLWTFWRKRSTRNVAALTIVTLSAIAQFVASKYDNGYTPEFLISTVSIWGRISKIDPALFVPNLLINGFWGSFLGQSTTTLIGQRFLEWWNHSPWIALSSCVLIASIFLFALFRLLRLAGRPSRIKLLLLAVYLMVCNSIFAINEIKFQLFEGQHPRYLYCSSIVVMLLVVSSIEFNKRNLMTNLVLLALLILPFAHGVRRNLHDTSVDEAWSNWRVECTKHNHDPHLGLKIRPWPWVMLVDEFDYKKDFDQKPMASIVNKGVSVGGKVEGFPKLIVEPAVIGSNVNVEVRSSIPNLPGRLLRYQGKAQRSPVTVQGGFKFDLFVPDGGAIKDRVSFRTDAEGIWRFEIPAYEFYFHRNWAYTFQAVLGETHVEATPAVELKVGY